MKTARIECYNDNTQVTMKIEEEPNKTYVFDGVYEAIEYCNENRVNIKGIPTVSNWQ